MNILGINTGHDSGAALINEQGVIAAINEERLSRIKAHHGFPHLSVEEVLSIGKITMEDIDIIAIEGLHIMPQQEIGYDGKSTDWKKKILGSLGLNKFFLGTEAGLSLVKVALKMNVRRIKKDIEKYFTAKGFKGVFQYVDHHYCHAAGAYYTQPLNEGVAITIDASGEGYCSRIYRCKNNKMELLHQISCYHSPAYYYAYVTKLLGFKPLRHEGKITGLAALGNAAETSKVFQKYIYFDAGKLSFINKGGYHFEAMQRLQLALKDFSKEDIAAGIQSHTEKIVCQYITAIINRFCNGKSQNVFLAGGIFANVKINQRILEQDKVSHVYVFPNMGDGGLNMGAALTASFDRKISPEKLILDHVYSGRNYSDQDIEKVLLEKNISYFKSANIAFDIASRVIEGKVVAVYSGAMEYGPRALGNRSIIYSAKDKSVNTWLNKRLNRTEFMPFAPYVRDVDFSEYFKIEHKNILPFKFMTITSDVTKKCEMEVPAIAHVDGTARPQIVFRESNPVYYDILTEYKKLTGIGVLVNTSFNMHEEPIINTPSEAIETYRQGELDVLAIGSFILER